MERKIKTGQRESNCLELVRKVIFTRNGEPVRNFWNNKSYLEVTDEEFFKNQTLYINSDGQKSYFGLLEEDRREIEQILRKAQPNENISQFPDFLFDRGFIEHFQITSSKTTRKGAEHAKKEEEFYSKVNRETEKLKQEWNSNPSFDETRCMRWEMNNPVHNHEYLIKSFENSWCHYMESYDKYMGNKEIGIFMVEYPEMALSMYENVYEGWISGMSQGDMREPEEFKGYRLSRDKELLNFIYRYKEQIKYVIFVSNQGIEIICLDKIPYLLKLMPWDYVILPMVVGTVSTLYNISIPIKQEEEEKKDE